MNDTLLADSLALAVPLEIDRARTMDAGLREQLAERLRPALQEGSDQLLYGGRLCAATFASYARALAILAFQPGGVMFAGLAFCAAHPGTRWGEYEVCPGCLADEKTNREDPR